MKREHKRELGDWLSGKEGYTEQTFYTPDGPKKSSVYVKNDKGNIKLTSVTPTWKSNVSFRARHQCDTN